MIGLTQRDKQSFTPTPTTPANLESSVNLTGMFLDMFLDCGRKLENQKRTHPDAGRTCNPTSTYAKFWRFAMYGISDL